MKKIFIFLISLSLSGNAKAALIPLKKEPTSNYSTKNTSSTFSTKADTPPREKKAKRKKQGKNDTEPERLQRSYRLALTAATVNSIAFFIFLIAGILIAFYVFSAFGIGLIVGAGLFLIAWIATAIVAGVFRSKYFDSLDGNGTNLDKKTKPTPAPKQDVVYLKNGSIIKGSLLETIPGVSVKIELLGGSIMVFKMDEVEKIVKE